MQTTVKLLAALLVAAAPFAPVASAQLSASSATHYPVGCPIPSVLANDTHEGIWHTPCPPFVTDMAGNLVYVAYCLQVVVLLPPDEVYVTYWNQVDMNGQQVPPGDYLVNGVPYRIDPNTQTAITPLGTPRLGLSRAFEICSPSDPNKVYAMAASGSSTTGLPLGCGLTFPLDFDALLLQSISNTNVFPNFIGVLDSGGRSASPHLNVPFIPALAGIDLDVAFAVLDPLEPCGVARVSGAHSLTIAP